MRPLVSVLMPVYNAEDTIHESIESIRNQNFIDYELIILLDGSTDNSKNIAYSYSDPKIRIYESPNVGLVKILNVGIGLSRGKYIARQDADDISLKARLGMQVNYLETNPEICLVGAWSEIISEKNKSTRYHRHPISSNAISLFLLFDNPFVHSSVMIKRSSLEIVGLYNEAYSCNPPEDYELWTRMANICKVANIPIVLLKYREMSSGISSENKALIQKNVIKISSVNLYNKYKKYLSANECKRVSFIYHDPFAIKCQLCDLILVFKFLVVVMFTKSIKNLEAAKIIYTITNKMIKNVIFCIIA